jgi:hypothetical protein
MTVLTRLLGFLLAGLLLTACSGTTVKSSSSSHDFKGKIKNVYIIGIAKNDYNRMLFENTFYSRLASEGIKAIPSSTDLPKNEEADRGIIIQKMRTNDCDSVLVTKVVDQRTQATFASDPSIYHLNWDSYYVESALFDLKTEEMIWSAHMETDLEKNLEAMMEKFVDEAVNDLKEKGLI